jgi:hypothetical protein
VYINPKKYNLHSRVLIKEPQPKHIVIVVNRKSRIIMKDGERINQQKETINKIKPNTKISLETTAPICSKTKNYLLSKDIKIINK